MFLFDPSPSLPEGEEEQVDVIVVVNKNPVPVNGLVYITYEYESEL